MASRRGGQGGDSDALVAHAAMRRRPRAVHWRQGMRSRRISMGGDRGAAREQAGGSSLRCTAGGCSSSPGGCRSRRGARPPRMRASRETVCVPTPQPREIKKRTSTKSGNSKHSGKKARNPIFCHAEIRRIHTIGKQLEIGRFHNITDIIKAISANLVLEQYEDGGYTN